MLNNNFKNKITAFFGFKPTPEQQNALEMVTDFIFSSDPHAAFILRGYAGTGKTSLVGALVKAMDAMRWKIILLAPTGRAAKVLSAHASHPAFTIHRKIYRQKKFTGDFSNFSLADNRHVGTLFLIDEASMISNHGLSTGSFGTGRLLEDLLEYVYGGEDCRAIFVGDNAQLPPVGEEASPALSVEMLKCLGVNATECNLTQVVRQEETSGILYNATVIRYLLFSEGGMAALPKMRLAGFPEVQRITGGELIEALEGAYSKCGMEETVVICRSNKRANVYNNGIRNRILYREEELSTGDQLMVAKNNYFWTEGNEAIDFIANGDIATVRRVRHVHELYGFRFAEVTLSFGDYDDAEVTANVLLDTLQADAPALPREESERLFQAGLADYGNVKRKGERMKRVKNDPHFNAIQVKYGYAVTCHKAQGGQWRTVFLDQGFLVGDNLNADYFRWLYTAVTRATEKLYLVNWPLGQIEA